MIRGGYLHNELLVRPVERLLRSTGARVRVEHSVRKGRDTGYVDVYACWPTRSLAVEAELTPSRVDNDVVKAIQLGVDLLVIVTPTAPIARSARRRLGMTSARQRRNGLEVWVYPLGPALERIAAWRRSNAALEGV